MKYSIRINKKLYEDIQLTAVKYGIDKSEVVNCSLRKFLRHIDVVQNKRQFLSYVRSILESQYPKKETVLSSFRINMKIDKLAKHFKNNSKGLNYIVAWNIFEDNSKFKNYKMRKPEIHYMTKTLVIV